MRVPFRQAWSRWRPDRFEAMVPDNRVTLLHDGAACLPAIRDAIASAEEEVLLEMYWFGSDRTGRGFAELLSEKARQGVRVCVIYDAVGSLEADPGMFDDMRAAGCDVREYNPIRPWRRRFNIGLVNNRDHRKIILVDGGVGLTGGVNFGDPWAPASMGGGAWRDDMIRIEGKAAAQMRSVFHHTWRELGGDLPGSAPRTLDVGDPSGGGGPAVRVLANDYRGERAAIRRSYLEKIERARSHIYIPNSYFVPDRAVRVSLGEAAARGVDVRVLLPCESDVPAVYFAGRRLYAWLMRRGIQLYEWRGTVLHAKTATIDDRWCTVGTYNMDYRSWRTNLEINVTVEDEGVAHAMAARFRADLEKSSRVDPHHWAYRPLSERVLEQFFYLFRKLL